MRCDRLAHAAVPGQRGTAAAFGHEADCRIPGLQRVKRFGRGIVDDDHLGPFQILGRKGGKAPVEAARIVVVRNDDGAIRRHGNL